VAAQRQEHALSPQARAALGIEAPSLTPNELLNAILKAPVDLLYNGGIGTYVKASDESHAEVGDRANDAIRVDGRDLRCKVVGEGGNLGCTQRGRIEYALKGGRIYTDAIDNSAGVDTSDHEVNIKILLGLVIADGEMTDKQRNALLAEMTDDVAALVLRDNYAQTQIISLAGRLGGKLLEQQQRFIRYLERQGELHRAIEFLPSDEEFAERRTKSIALTAPERAVLLAYGKMWLYDQVLASPLPDDPWVGRAGALLPAAARRRATARCCRAIRCGARSWPRMWSTAWSTTSARPSRTGCWRSPGAAGAGGARLPAGARVLWSRAAVGGDQRARQPRRRRHAGGDADRAGAADDSGHHLAAALAPAGRADGADDRAAVAGGGRDRAARGDAHGGWRRWRVARAGAPLDRCRRAARPGAPRGLRAGAVRRARHRRDQRGEPPAARRRGRGAWRHRRAAVDAAPAHADRRAAV
jgi:hypothetical protein